MLVPSFTLEDFESLHQSEQAMLVFYTINQDALESAFEYQRYLIGETLSMWAANDNDEDEHSHMKADYQIIHYPHVINFVRCLIQCKFNRVLTKLTYNPDHKYG